MSGVVNAAGRLSRDEQRALTRERLLSSAQEIFVERGFHGASVEEIAEGAGYTRGAFYSNFESKDDIFLAVFDQRLRVQIDEIGAVLQSSSSLDEALGVLRGRTRADLEAWMILATEFWLYAMRRPEVRPRLAEIDGLEREAYRHAIIAQFDERGVEPPAPVDDLATIVQALDHHLPKMHAVNPDGVREHFYYDAISLLLDAGVALAASRDQ